MNKFKEPYKIDNIKFENIRYVDKKETNDKTIVYTKYEDKGKLCNFVIQTPSLRNINDVISHKGVSELEIPLVGQNNVKTEKFIGFLNNLDKQITSDAKINTNWFNNFYSGNVIRYQKTIRDSSDYKNGMIKIKIIKNDNFETILQVNNKDAINIQDIEKDSWVKMILEVYAIWINKNGFGIFLRPVLVSFKPFDKSEYNYKFLEESDNEDVINTVMDNDSIFMRQEDSNTEAGETSVLQLPLNNQLSSTSSEE
jgi:hypothetical protein